MPLEVGDTVEVVSSDMFSAPAVPAVGSVGLVKELRSNTILVEFFYWTRPRDKQVSPRPASRANCFYVFTKRLAKVDIKPGHPAWEKFCEVLEEKL